MKSTTLTCRGVLVFLKFAQFSSELTKTWSSGATECGVWIGNCNVKVWKSTEHKLHNIWRSVKFQQNEHTPGLFYQLTFKFIFTNTWRKKIKRLWKWVILRRMYFQQECILVGCVPPACWPYLAARGCIPRGMSARGGVPGGGDVCPGGVCPGGCLLGGCLPRALPVDRQIPVKT